MTVIIGVISLVFGSYLVQPEWFDNGPYEIDSKYESLQECKIAKDDKNGICVGESPSKLFMVSGKEVSAPAGKLEFVACDYWAGCYLGSK